MADNLQLPLDTHTAERLQALGRDPVQNPEARRRFLENRDSMMEQHGLGGIDLSRLDENVVKMLASPEFERVVETRDVPGVREFIRDTLGDAPSLARVAGTFDFDFDVEVEVEVVAVAVAVFDFAARKTNVPDTAELERRRSIVQEALQSLRQGEPG